jgi:hypothetical protein
MKNIIRLFNFLIVVLFGACLLSFALLPKSIYSIKLKDLEGRAIELAKFLGKKMVFIMLSGKEPDSVLTGLDFFCQKHKDSAVVIGVPSIEDGYNETDKETMKQVFSIKCPHLVLTESMYTRKASAGQSELMQWFTHTDQNLHFGYDVTGVGWKFFVAETGELYAALGSHAQLSSALIERVMNRRSKSSLSAHTN